jgi:hypothetical protein
MKDNNFPDKVIPITSLRIVRDKNKKCTCRNRKFEVDTENKEIICMSCGAVVQPYDALYELAAYYERIEADVKRLLEQRRQILNWKPHLLPLRELERIYLGGSMLPCCPHCGRGIEARELVVGAVSKKSELERRKFEGKE